MTNCTGQNVLTSCNQAGLPEHNLRLKVGTPVMLLRNLDLARDQCNGSRCVVREIRHNSILLENMSTQKTMWLFRVGLVPQDRRSTSMQFKRTQFPTRLCMAMTINKSQGQTGSDTDTSEPICRPQSLPRPTARRTLPLIEPSQRLRITSASALRTPGKHEKRRRPTRCIPQCSVHTARASQPYCISRAYNRLPTTNDPESPMTTDHGSDYDELQAAFEFRTHVRSRFDGA